MTRSNILRCKFCDWSTPKWKGHRDRDVNRAWIRLTEHVKYGHPDQWMDIATLMGEEDKVEDNPFREENDE